MMDKDNARSDWLDSRMDSNRAIAGGLARASSLQSGPQVCKWIHANALPSCPKHSSLPSSLIPDGLRGTKKRHRDGLKLFCCIATLTRTILLVYRERNLSHG
jgi:hypothetical protein